MTAGVSVYKEMDRYLKNFSKLMGYLDDRVSATN